jgi:hypothetical protein
MFPDRGSACGCICPEQSDRKHGKQQLSYRRPAEANSHAASGMNTADANAKVKTPTMTEKSTTVPCPSVEAASCGTPIISDHWLGLADLLPEHEAILIADKTDDVSQS